MHEDYWDAASKQVKARLVSSCHRVEVLAKEAKR